jgi:hypothetical protein
VSRLPGSFAFGVVQVRACRRKATRSVDTQGRRGRHTGSYADRGERREVRAWAARNVKLPGRRDTLTTRRWTRSRRTPPMLHTADRPSQRQWNSGC